jgi:hypothetical protein
MSGIEMKVFDQLRRDAERFGKAVADEALKAAEDAAAQVVKQAVETAAPRRTGQLASSVKIFESMDRAALSGQARRRLLVGPEKRKGFYGFFLEKGWIWSKGRRKRAATGNTHSQSGPTEGSHRIPHHKCFTDVKSKRPSRGRHEFGCKVCAHPQRRQIEDEWCAWGNTTRLAKQYGLSRDSLYRHCHALRLFERRGRNLKGALEKIIEQADSVAVNAGAVVQAIQAYAKINSAGQWIDRTEQVNLNQLFERMSTEELEAYARDGTLLGWFTEIVGATSPDSQEGDKNG